ncbi:hypothetical protein K5I29_05515 [Flavobacterium agricola]|uniref:DUF8202 domain-containing protein n=1 Tax=Flavobacterium agricola TaxID=2870839 RepID=A0ABY6M1P3_9FLAO|nr:hypothetical protein [Flavobacterium agricola]UYW02356.1 hypothetical protein K5I29_05515 [Flavobacterium agricola]
MKKQHYRCQKWLGLLFFLAFSMLANAQEKPGGTSLEVELWLKAENVPAADSTYVYQWQDASGKGRSFAQNGTQPVPVLFFDGMNYYPRLHLSENNTKLIGPTNIMDNTKEYYIYHVSKSNATTTAAVLSFNEELNNSYGWRGLTTHPWLYSGGDRDATLGIGKPYSINSAFTPNQSSTNTYLYVDGVKNVFTNTGRVFSTSSTNRMIIGNTNTGTSWPFYGDINEIIVLSAPKGTGAPNDADVLKVNSYLALKYGTTLKSLDGASVSNYLASDNSVFWNASANTAYNTNVFGLGRDDASGLNQKQAESIKEPGITVFIDELSYLNNANNGVITTDKSFLLLGSNGQGGDMDYVYPENTTYLNGNLPSPVNKRSLKILRAQNTNGFGTVNFKLSRQMRQVQFVLVSTTEDFIPGTTRFYPVEDGIVANVAINDGDFVGFGLQRGSFATNNIKAELWLDATKIDLENTEHVDIWYDVSGNVHDFVKNGTNDIPVFDIQGGMNFNPKVDFSESNGTKLVGKDVLVDANRSYYVFTVSRTEANGNQTVFSLRNTTVGSTGWRGTPAHPWVYSGSDRDGNNNGKLFGINVGYFPNKTTSEAAVFSSGIKQLFNSADNRLNAGTNIPVLGARDTGSAYSLNGYVSEVLVYSTPHTESLDDNFVHRINSYLAIKYGITLLPEDNNAATGVEYLASDGSVIWHGKTIKTHNQHIFGLGRDSGSGLYQKQATNYEYNSVIAYLGNLEEANLNNNSVVADNNFLLFGSNGLIGGETYSQLANTTYANGTTITKDIFERYKRTLRVNKTGTGIGPINLKLANDLAAVPYILVSSSEAFDPGATRLYPVVNGVAKDVELNDNDYIGFVLDRKSPGGSQFDVELWLKAEDIALNDGANLNLWFDQSLYSRDFKKNGIVSSPKFFVNDGLNFYPRVLINRNSLINDTNLTQANKEYYIYHVSTNHSEANTTGVLFTFNRGTWNNSYGWSNQSPWLYSNGDHNTIAFGNKTTAVSAAFNPNKTGAGFNSYLYANGKLDVFANASRVSATAGQMVFGDQNGSGTYYPFNGDVSEVIVLSAPLGTGSPSATDVQKVNSYLSLKYGITLFAEDGLNTSTYLASDNTVIWDATANTGYNNNVFGIGRDDLSGLNQKQSRSYNDGRITAYIGNFENLNRDNLGSIASDKSFLLFGNNNGKGFEKYEYEVDAQFANAKITERINARHRYTLKAQNTNNFEAINMAVNIGAMYVLVSSDPTFAPQSTNVYPVSEENIVENLQINSGDYVGFATYAVGPGGVIDGLSVWLVANTENIDLAGNKNVNVWRDVSPFGKDYSYDAVQLNGKQYPQYIDCSPLMNFRPAVEFSQSSYLAIYGDLRNPAPMAVNTPDEFTTFTVYNSYESGGTRYYTHGFGGVVPNSAITRYPAMGFYPPNGAGRLRNDGAGETNVNGDTPGFERGATAFQMINTKSGTRTIRGTATHDFGQTSDVADGGFNFGTGFRLASGGTIGGASINDASFKGLLSEVFFFDRTLTSAEQEAIRSYVGSKYAITLKNVNGTDNFDYKLSDGRIVWNGTDAKNVPFHHNVAGLIRDDNAGLHINIARSTDKESIVTMFAGDQVCNDNQSALTNDFSALFWGNNNKPLNESINYDPNDQTICGEISSKIERVWMVEKTNLPTQKVTLRAGGADFLYQGDGFEVFLLVADTPDKLQSNQWDQIIPGSFVNGEHQFTYTFTDKYTYFTFAAKNIPGICESCEFTGTKKLDFRRVNWPTPGEKSRSIDLGDDFMVNVNVTDASNVLRNRYPRTGSSNTLRLDRGGIAAVTTNINFTNATNEPISASTTFEIFNIDRTGAYNLDDVIVKGYCGTGAITPKVSYVYGRFPDRSSYSSSTSNATQAHGKAKARGERYSGGVGYTNQRGRMLIHFDQPVERIEITYAVDGPTNNYTKRIGIGPMELTCVKVAPLPEPNDEGLIFTKQGTQELELCEDVSYVFQIINTNCGIKPVNFSDQLPAGMYWDPNSLIIDSDAISENDILFNGGKVDLQNIQVPGGAQSFVFRLTAKFEDTATAGNYINTSSITYDRIANGPETLPSTDRFTGLPETVTVATSNSARPEGLDTTLRADSSCFNLDQTLEFTLTLNNKNAFALTNTLIGFDFDQEGFSLVPGSISATGITLNTALTDELLSYEGLVIPAGVSTIKFKIKASASKADFDIDALTTDPTDQIIAYDVFIDSDDICIANLSQSGELILPYCTYCTKPPMTPTGNVFKPSSVGISLLPVNGIQEFNNWPTSVPNGYLVINSTKNAFVLTRTTPDKIANPIEGMVIYNTNENCLSLFNGTTWVCIQRDCAL